jgi:MFS family permease
MPAESHAATKAILRHRPFQLYFLGRVFSNFSRQIVAVAVGWQVYALTNDPFALGMVGLLQFLPTLLLTFFSGHAADHFDRKRVVQICQWVEAITAGVLAWGSMEHWLTVAHIYAASVVFGITASFERPAAAAMVPSVVPTGFLQQGTALSSGAMHFASIAGPALGGFMYAVSPGLPYGLTAVFWLLAGVLNGSIGMVRQPRSVEVPSLGTLFAGVRFVRSNPAVLGTISLDLFAVLLGGATALLPIYASDILHTGPWGLGLLRAGPSIGALVMTIYLARHPIARRVGIRMFQSVILFGLATIVFAVSRDVWLSVVSLIVMGAADMISVVIRMSLVQLATPDEMRGRVSAVNFLFINASNQLGEFESGLTAAWFGTVTATIIGGVGTIAVALLWMKLFPTLRDVEKLE